MILGGTRPSLPAGDSGWCFVGLGVQWPVCPMSDWDAGRDASARSEQWGWDADGGDSDGQSGRDPDGGASDRDGQSGRDADGGARGEQSGWVPGACLGSQHSSEGVSGLTPSP